MKTKIYKVDSCAVGGPIIREAAEVIRSGGLVAFPTETVYGLGADALSPEAAGKIYAAKGRPSDNPLIVHISKMEDLKRVTDLVSKKALLLAEAFWPGPLTLIVKKKKEVPFETTGGLDTVAVRMPNHPTALALIRESGCLIAAPSANASGRPSPTLAKHVAEDLDGKIPLILDGGEVGIGIESTILDLTQETPMVLRPGYITNRMISGVIGEVRTDPGIIKEDSKRKPKAPGMKYRHYAPKAQLMIVSGPKESVVKQINAWVDERQAEGKKTGVIGTDETVSSYHGDMVLSIGDRENEDTIARHLYRVLRTFDEGEVDVIYSESFATPRIGQAIMNRLIKAAGHKVITVS